MDKNDDATLLTGYRRSLVERCDAQVGIMLWHLSHSFAYNDADELVVSDRHYEDMRRTLEVLEERIGDLHRMFGVPFDEPFGKLDIAVCDLKLCLHDIHQAGELWTRFRNHEYPRHAWAVRMLAFSIGDAARNTLRRLDQHSPKRNAVEEGILDALATCACDANGIEDAISALLDDARKEEPFNDFDLDFVDRQLGEMHDVAETALKRYEASLERDPNEREVI